MSRLDKIFINEEKTLDKKQLSKLMKEIKRAFNKIDLKMVDQSLPVDILKKKNGSQDIELAEKIFKEVNSIVEDEIDNCLDNIEEKIKNKYMR